MQETNQSYTPQIFTLKINGADGEAIAKKFFDLETLNMEVTGNIKQCEKVADKIIGI